jgi:hypothetical protein
MVAMSTTTGITMERRAVEVIPVSATAIMNWGDKHRAEVSILRWEARGVGLDRRP